MNYYRIFVFNSQTHTEKRHGLAAPDDGSAFEQAKEFASGNTIEIWESTPADRAPHKQHMSRKPLEGGVVAANTQGPDIVEPGLTLSSADVYACAHGMIVSHGADAESHARQRAEIYAGKDDSEGRAIWLAIATAIDALQDNAAASPERIDAP